MSRNYDLAIHWYQEASAQGVANCAEGISRCESAKHPIKSALKSAFVGFAEMVDQGARELSEALSSASSSGGGGSEGKLDDDPIWRDMQEKQEIERKKQLEAFAQGMMLQQIISNPIIP